MSGLAALHKALPATDDEGRPVLVIALESTTGAPGTDGEDYVWVIAHDGSIRSRRADNVTVDWIFAPVEGEAEKAGEPEGVQGQLPDSD